MEELKDLCIQFFELEEEDLAPEKFKELVLIVIWMTALLIGFYFFVGSL